MKFVGAKQKLNIDYRTYRIYKYGDEYDPFYTLAFYHQAHGKHVKHKLESREIIIDMHIGQAFIKQPVTNHFDRKCEQQKWSEYT